MAKEGARLTSFYVAAPLCTPSRAALMTGCYPRRVSMEPPSSLAVALPNIPPGKRFPVCLAGDGNGLNLEEITIAEVARSVGYRTGIFGKWHLGDQPEFLPTRQGFEEFFGLPYSHDITPKHPRQEYFQFPPLPLLEGEEALYNLKTDISEQTNLKDQHPEIVAQLKKAMQEFESAVTKNARPAGQVENPKALTMITIRNLNFLKQKPIFV